MMTLYDEEEIMRSYIESERYEAAQEAKREEAEKAAVRMLKDGLTVGQIENYFPVLTVARLKELEKEYLQSKEFLRERSLKKLTKTSRIF